MVNPVNTAVFLQEACTRHRFIRSRDTSNVVERPQRLRAVHIGIAAATARFEQFHTGKDLLRSGQPQNAWGSSQDASTAYDLASALGSLNLATTSSVKPQHIPVEFVHSSAVVDISNHPAVKFVHGDELNDEYLANLQAWAKDSQAKISRGESEIPGSLSQGDLYLCPESLDAIQGALGTVCEAVDVVMNSTRSRTPQIESKTEASRAFVAIRPPGHHCGEDTPSGFCFVNNVCVAAAHAHLKHGIRRSIILDIDLHHGNGTQSIAWRINEETYRKNIEEAHGAPPGKPGLQMFYGSLHDILSYPCEDGKTELIQAASVSIHGPHGQHIENIHLRPYSSEKEFWENLYAGPYSGLLQRAGEFLERTGGAGDDVMIFISCGFDASEHEYPSMSRHRRHVPTAFYHRFALDARKFAERFAHGRLVSVLEGGYSDRALTSGAMAHLSGLAIPEGADTDGSWWSLDNLIELEKVTKKRRGGHVSQPEPPKAWIRRTLDILATIDPSSSMPKTKTRTPVPSSTRTLRERNPKTAPVGRSDSPSNDGKQPKSMGINSPPASPGKANGSKKPVSKGQQGKAAPTKEPIPVPSESELDSDDSSQSALSDIPEEGMVHKKLPRVILRLGPRPDIPSDP
ncbi:Arginase/deacetylase [Wolfiporia cocos MD-104 SS10]|uniref:Arginase/deacetylase n=1 Tax=Wolfiporia cocos (strain MD-104) TaxID=742152 RepID=A0A2H3JC29_WOLCO|nr:Arginase/deacetylase [Wolfiporia cocos MD-104 SS10]